MGTSAKGTLTATEMQGVAQARDAMSAVGSGTTTTARFNYVAAFDGTNNDRNNVPAGAYKTNVANLADQVIAATPTNQIVELGYFKGVGTGGDEGGLLQAGVLPTKVVIATAEKAYTDFQQNVRDYYAANSSNFKPEDITASIACFSRGCPTGLEFAWMINDRGVTAADGTVLAPPGSIKISGGFAMMDPVNRFVDDSRGIPPNVTSPVLVAYATDETRTDFRPMNFSNDPRVTAVWVRGNHCGIGGGYDLNGTSAAVLEGITGYFQNLGTELGAVPDHLKFNPNAPATLYTEEFQIARNGQIVEDIETGTQKREWRVDPGPRKMIGTPTPSATNPQTSSYFQDRYEQEDINQAMDRVANLTESDIREIAAYEGLTSLVADARVNLDFNSLTSEVNSVDEYTISTPSIANMVLAGMTVQEAVSSTLISQLGTSLSASGLFGQAMQFDATLFSQSVDSGNLSNFMDGLSQLEAKSYLAQYFINTSLGIDIPILNSEGQQINSTIGSFLLDFSPNPGGNEMPEGVIAALAGELRPSMDTEKYQMYLDGFRDPDDPNRPQIRGEFMYIPQEILLGMSARFSNDFFPSAEALAEDVPDIFDLEGPNPTIDVKVYVNGQLHFDGGCSTKSIVPPIYWSEGNKFRYTIFVGGQLFADDDSASYIDPYQVAQRAAHADAAALNGPNWASAPTPSWFLSWAGTLRSAAGSPDELSLEGLQLTEQLPGIALTGTTEFQSAQLVQAMSLFDIPAASDGLPLSERLTRRPIEYALDV